MRYAPAALEELYAAPPILRSVDKAPMLEMLMTDGLEDLRRSGRNAMVMTERKEETRQQKRSEKLEMTDRETYSSER